MAESNNVQTSIHLSKHKIFMASFLVLATVVLLLSGAQALMYYDSYLTQEVEVFWKPTKGAVLKPGPASFQLDKEKSILLHRGQINDSVKKELIALLNVDGVPQEHRPKSTNDYWRAIDTLAYQSNVNESATLFLLLLLAGLGGSIGVQIRSISNFIGVTCYQEAFELERWWPWYFLRPFLGFLLGVFAVVLVKAELFMGGEASINHQNLWWLGLSVLVGFGSSDFSDRLRLLSKSLFGGG